MDGIFEILGRPGMQEILHASQQLAQWKFIRNDDPGVRPILEESSSRQWLKVPCTVTS